MRPSLHSNCARFAQVLACWFDCATGNLGPLHLHPLQPIAYTKGDLARREQDEKRAARLEQLRRENERQQREAQERELARRTEGVSG